MLYGTGKRWVAPERGSDRFRFYESYDLPLSAGAHTFVALVWQLGERSRHAPGGAGRWFSAGGGRRTRRGFPPNPR
ncbi:MAG: hypothetical protein R2838_09560 [Caldilineaceae bacterium]